MGASGQSLEITVYVCLKPPPRRHVLYTVRVREDVCQTDTQSTDTSCKQHVRHIRLGQPETLVVVEHIMDTGHSTNFNNIFTDWPRYKIYG